jgi:hypothetical protein
VAPAPKDQHTVYRSGVGKVVGSGNAALLAAEESVVKDSMPVVSKEGRKRAGTTTLPTRPSPKKPRKPSLQQSPYDVSSQTISDAFFRVEIQPGFVDAQREF